jgi:SH3 domain protein
MRQGPLYLLLTALCVPPTLHAEESQPLALNPTPASAPAAAQPSDSAAQIAVLQQQLAESERQRSELQSATSGERETAQIGRLRQDNQRLKLQLKQAQAEQPPRLFSEQQLWFGVGGGTALLAFIVGRLSAGGRNKRRSEWV